MLRLYEVLTYSVGENIEIETASLAFIAMNLLYLLCQCGVTLYSTAKEKKAKVLDEVVVLFFWFYAGRDNIQESGKTSSSRPII
jgi:hypothetical protein